MKDTCVLCIQKSGPVMDGAGLALYELCKIGGIEFF